jgi:peptidoglycan/LPS O-acetylase OafA/YrhL
MFRAELNTSLFFALGYTLCQPVMVWTSHVFGKYAFPFVTLTDWTRFEITEFGLGSIVGSFLFHSRRWPEKTWRRTWAEATIPAVAQVASLDARILPTSNIFAWTLLALVSGAAAGCLLASVVRGVVWLVHLGAPKPAARRVESD